MTVTSEITSSAKESNSARIYLAADLGKSNCKYLWAGDGVNYYPHPLWLGSEIAQNVPAESLRRFDVEGELSESFWIRTGDRNVLIGGSAHGYPVSFATAKVDVAALQVVAGLGIAALQSNLTEYHADIALVIPLNEFRFRDEITARLEEMGQSVVVCGKEQKFTVTMQYFPEGAGLYLLYKGIKDSGSVSLPGRVIVLMLGHRNLSILVFDDGKLNPQFSQTSDTLGFWHTFKSEADSSGVRETDYSSLMAAVTTGELQQLSVTKAKLWDFSQPATTVVESYMAKVDQFYQDHVLPLLSQRGAYPTILLGGGVAHVMRGVLKAYFERTGFETTENLWFADALSHRLPEIARASRKATGDMARPIRYADCYGIYQLLLSSLRGK